MIELQAGEVIGFAGGEGHLAMDFGAFDGRVPPLGFANPARFWSDPLGLDPYHMVCPIDYYAPEIRDQLRGRLGEFTGQRPRTVEPICGEVEQDELGTAQGTWYRRGTLGPSESPHLALVHDNVDPSLGVFSFGTSVPGLGPGVYFFHPQTSGRINLDFSRVAADGSVYCYASLFGRSGRPVSPTRTILIQLTSETTLRIETQDAAECGPGPWGFQSDLADFER
ncbi:MAG: hypothetical protein BZY88_02550 [SAR202 cluster bacterium Io17-Chloro-G9]|nr:MAG: hypothetical protein BZY88_02550 [SAR202 cluster bacterium Io17-Chloro-G9]